MASPSIAFVSVVGAVLIWSTSFVATKIALQGFAPFTLASLRLLLATLVLGAIGWFTKQIHRPPLPDLLKMGFAGFVGLTLYFSLENYGLKFASSSDGVLLISSFPILSMLLETVLFRVKVSLKRLAGAVVAIVGVALIVDNAAHVDGSQRLIGNILLICSGIAWAIYNFITRSIVEKYTLLTLNFFQSLSATILFVPLALTEGQQWTDPSVFSIQALLYLAFNCSVAAYLLYNYGLRTLDATSAVSLMNAMPVFGVVFSVVVLHETITALQLLGGAIVLMGVSLSVQRPATEAGLE